MSALPQEIGWLFWEADVHNLDTERHDLAIVARVLERGRLEDVAWLFRCYGADGVRERVVLVRPQLSAMTWRCWQLFFNLPEQACLDERPASSSAPWID